MAAIITISDEKRKELDALAAKLGLSSNKELLEFVLKLLRVIAERTEQTTPQHSLNLARPRKHSR